MIYNRIGAVCLFDRAEYRVGDMVVATAESPWEGLYGTITEICDGDDRQTGLDTRRCSRTLISIPSLCLQK